MARRGEEMAGAETFETLRPLMFSLAYRMLGSVSEAEDIVQEAFVRFQTSINEGVEIESTKAFLSAVVTRLSIDHLRSARARRETYIGQWLPEPLLTDDAADDPAEQAEKADSLSMAFLLLLERLTPVERAVFLLHDVFGYDYDEISTIVGKTETNCRQLAARARSHIESERPRFDPSMEKRDELATRFMAAMTNGDVDGLIEMLAADVVVYGDGGGKAPQWMLPIAGAERAARLFAGLGGQMQEFGVVVQLRQVNGQKGAILLTPDEQVICVFSFDIADGAVQAVRSVINPDKLRHIGAVADVREFLRRGVQR
jgi:RNA polymerase sigma-70 factor, ECF subfamily